MSDSDAERYLNDDGGAAKIVVEEQDAKDENGDPVYDRYGNYRLKQVRVQAFWGSDRGDPTYDSGWIDYNERASAIAEAQDILDEYVQSSEEHQEWLQPENVIARYAQGRRAAIEKRPTITAGVEIISIRLENEAFGTAAKEEPNRRDFSISSVKENPKTNKSERVGAQPEIKKSLREHNASEIKQRGVEIKQLYDEAKELFKEAKNLRAKYKNKSAPETPEAAELFFEQRADDFALAKQKTEAAKQNIQRAQQIRSTLPALKEIFAAADAHAIAIAERQLQDAIAAYKGSIIHDGINQGLLNLRAAARRHDVRIAVDGIENDDAGVLEISLITEDIQPFNTGLMPTGEARMNIIVDGRVITQIPVTPEYLESYAMAIEQAVFQLNKIADLGTKLTQEQVMIVINAHINEDTIYGRKIVTTEKRWPWEETKTEEVQCPNSPLTARIRSYFEGRASCDR